MTKETTFPCGFILERAASVCEAYQRSINLERRWRICNGCTSYEIWQMLGKTLNTLQEEIHQDFDF